MEGWIKLHRKSFESSVWTKPTVWFVWSWCLIKANHKKRKFPFAGKDMELKPGQFITGVYKAVEELPGVTVQNFRTAIKYLKSTNRITTKSTNQFTIISICKWKQYQGKLTSDLTNNQQTTNKRLTTDKNVKNVKNITYGNNDINKIIDSLKEKLELPSLDQTIKSNRQYANHLLRASKSGVSGVLWLIDQASQDDWWRNHITSTKDLYYNRVKIIATKRGGGKAIDATQILKERQLADKNK